VCEVVNHSRRQEPLPEDANYSFDDESDGGMSTEFSHFEEFPSSVGNSKDYKNLIQALQRHYPPHRLSGEKIIYMELPGGRLGLEADEGVYFSEHLSQSLYLFHLTSLNIS
jgi:hypothetical protein